MLLLLNKDKNFGLPNLVNLVIFIKKNSELRKINEKLAMASRFDLTRFYDVIMRDSVF